VVVLLDDGLVEMVAVLVALDSGVDGLLVGVDKVEELLVAIVVDEAEAVVALVELIGIVVLGGGVLALVLVV
jgi:coenzyme F420-reducing hydrogenase delta subunit